MNTTHRLFVYGSLRSGFKSPAYEYLARFFSPLGDAFVQGRFYFDGNVPVACPTNSENYIPGELYELENTEEFDWVIGQLDDYEGLNVMPGEKPRYRRDRAMVNYQGTWLEAWVYWFNAPVTGMPEIDAADILKYLLNKNGGKSE
ncbi:MAG: gamma-glutamylcyclotransferase [Ferruginibacter sp.]|nr:gamma-glutamylcyclotransferase [Ferruginibacter sp.]